MNVFLTLFVLAASKPAPTIVLIPEGIHAVADTAKPRPAPRPKPSPPKTPDAQRGKPAPKPTGDPQLKRRRPPELHFPRIP